MSAKESPSSSSSSSSSPSNSPETPRKAQKSPPASPKAAKVPESPTSSLETPKKPQESPSGSPEEEKVPESPTSSPETPKKPQKSSTTSPESTKVPESPTSSPETPKKVQKSPSRSPEKEKDPKSPRGDLNKPNKVLWPPTGSPEEEKVPKSPRGDLNKPKKVLRAPITFPEAPKDDAKSPAGKPKVTPKPLTGNKLFTSSLQVFLQKKQETELVKSIEYKDKLERGEIDEEEDDEAKEERREGRRGSEDGAIDKEEKKEAMKPPPLTKKGDKDGKEENYAKKTKESKGKTEEKRKIEKESEKDRMGKEETVTNEKKAKVTKKEEKEKNNEDNKKVAEKVKKEKSDAGKTETKKEEKKQPEGKMEIVKEEKKENEAEKKGEVKKEEKTKEVTTKEKMPVEKREKRKKEETREEDVGKEEKEVKKGVEETKKKKEGRKEEKAHGHLYLKRKRTFNPWKEYYFLLDGLLLTYYRSQQDYERLSGMKGSLDLSLVEEVQPRKAGLLKTHHPFCLSRRNLPSIHLAADTREEQSRWIGLLQAAVGPRRLSCHSSDRTLNSGAASAPCDEAAKSSTLPARVKSISSCSSSEDEEEKKKKEEKEEEEEEESELIKPKKVTRVPIGMPLVKVDLGHVKLKKVEKNEVKTEDVKEGNAADVSKSPASPREGQRQGQEDQERETSPAELFGVVLKKAKNKEDEEEKEGETGGPRDGSTSPGMTSKRPSKQAVIPLNNRKLLVVPEVQEAKSSKVSQATLKRTTPERRKSPSPSLPISKSVKALTKSAEEVRATQVESTEGKGKGGGVVVCHARTSELNYSEVEDIPDVEEVTETEVPEGSKEEIQGKKDMTGNKEALKDDERQKEEKAVKKVPPAEVLKAHDVEKDKDNKEDTRKETPDETTLREDVINSNSGSQQVEAAAEEHKRGGSCLTEDKTATPHPDSLSETNSVATPLTPPVSPASSVTSIDSESVSKGPCGSRDLGKEMYSNAEAEKLKTKEEHEEEEVEMIGSSDAPRERTGTNESSASSCPEGGEKKPGKFKLLKSKFSVGGSVKDRKEDSAVQKEPKEKKRRGSNTFTNLLAGKKTKEGGKKPAEEESQPSQLEDASRPGIAPQNEVTAPSESPSTEAKASPSSMVSAVAVEVTPPSGPQPFEEISLPEIDAFLANLVTDDDGQVKLRTTPTCSEARDSIYSHTSSGSRDEPPPSIPEKTYMRVPSPNHDVPQNNRPVVDMHLLSPEDRNEDEDEDSQRVDGILTEEQIQAVLNANENRDKRKRSKSRGQLFAQPDVVKDTHTSADWTSKRPSCTSFSSIDSDEALLTTNFLSFDRRSSSSGSIKALRTDGGDRSSSGESLSPEVESPADPMRRAPRATGPIASKNRVSLTSPEFTVKEEEGLSSPETPKARPTRDSNDEDEDAGEEQHDDKDELQAESEHEDFFPVVGGDVQLRQMASVNLPSSDLRTSGIVSLKEFLKAEDEGDFSDVKSGISRLGHSAAVEKLKQATNEQ